MAAAEDDLDMLYSAPLTGFVKARNALVKRLKAEGDATGAKDVAALKKPAMAAWVLNQLVGRHGELVQRVLASVDRQRDLQLGALDGGLDTEALHQARANERSLTAELMGHAEAILVDGGQVASRNNLDRAAKALRSVALHPASRELLVIGRLEEDSPSGGFEAAAEQIDPALLLAALTAKPARPKKNSGTGDDFFARAVRRSDDKPEDAGPTLTLAVPPLAVAPTPAIRESTPEPANEPVRKRTVRDAGLARSLRSAPTKRAPPLVEAAESSAASSPVHAPSAPASPPLAVQARTAPAAETPDAAGGVAPQETARHKAARLEKIARRAEAEARLAGLRLEREEIDGERATAAEHVAELEEQLEAARIESRRIKRRVNDLDERIRKAEKRLAVLDS
jgi:hypothetical protein